MRYRLSTAPLAWVAIFSALCLATACQEDVTRPGGSDPAFAISDANHSSGNAHFFFLPPVVSQPHPSGTFDGSADPVVEICEFTTTCGSVIGRFTRRPRGDLLRGRNDDDDDFDDDDGNWVVKKARQHYSIYWDTKRCSTGSCSLDPARTYRIRILVAGVELGFADVDLVPKKDSLRNVHTNEYIGLVNGKSLLVKFRIEVGAINVVPASGGGTSVAPAQGGTVATADGGVALTIPAGALPPSATPTTITVAPAASPAPDPKLVPGTAFDFGPSGTQFSQPVAIKIAYDPASLPAGAAEVRLRLFTSVAGAWQLVPGSRVDPVSHTVTASVSHFSEYVVGSLPPVIQTIVVRYVDAPGYHTGAAFQLVWGGYITSPISWDASAAAIQASLQTIPPLAQVLVTGSLGSRAFTVDLSPYGDSLWVGSYNGGDYAGCYSSGILNGDPYATPANVSAACAIATDSPTFDLYNGVASTQVLTLDAVPTGGSFQFVWGGYLSAPVPWNATAAEIQAIVGAIPTMGQVAVTGSLASKTVSITYVSGLGALYAGHSYTECFDAGTAVSDGYAGGPNVDAACTIAAALTSQDGSYSLAGGSGPIGISLLVSN